MLVSIFWTSELSEKAESEFQEARASLRNDFLNSVNKTVSDVSVAVLMLSLYQVYTFLSDHIRRWPS